MTPHLVKWQEQFKDRGFTVVEVNDGGRDSLEELQEHIEEAGIQFPVLHDKLGRVIGRYHVAGYPMAYLIGRDGKIIWAGHPFDVEQIEREIEAALGAS